MSKNEKNPIINQNSLFEINNLLSKPDIEIVSDLNKVIEKYGSPDVINAKARKAREIPNILRKLEKVNPQYAKDLLWLIEQSKSGKFVLQQEYINSVLKKTDKNPNITGNPVTLEVSALQYFPWLIELVKHSIENKQLLPGRFIRVRNMREQENDGDLLAITAAMQILGFTCVETLDTKGTDGSNIHLTNGAETIFGWLGGVGQPNEHPLAWIDEFLYYYTNYGITEVLNINPGTVILGYMLYQLGVDINFKISVFMGNDNPYSIFWTLMTAKLFARDDGSTPLVGFNLSNSANNYTLLRAAIMRDHLNFSNEVRLEHHVTEPKDIVAQPYDRRDEVVDLAQQVSGISAKHEAGIPSTEIANPHPSKIGHYFRTKSEIFETGDMINLQQNFMDKVAASNSTAKKLIKKGIPFIAAKVHHS